jgi:hypothetical protein
MKIMTSAMNPKREFPHVYPRALSILSVKSGNGVAIRLPDRCDHSLAFVSWQSKFRLGQAYVREPVRLEPMTRKGRSFTRRKQWHMNEIEISSSIKLRTIQRGMSTPQGIWRMLPTRTAFWQSVGAGVRTRPHDVRHGRVQLLQWPGHSSARWRTMTKRTWTCSRGREQRQSRPSTDGLQVHVCESIF